LGDNFEYHKVPKTFDFPIPFYSIKGNKELWGGQKLYNHCKEFENFFWIDESFNILKDLTGLTFFAINYNEVVSSIPFETDVILSHQPAYGLADRCNDSFHTKMVKNC
jgi:hypothetical protein